MELTDRVLTALFEQTFLHRSPISTPNTIAKALDVMPADILPVWEALHDQKAISLIGGSKDARLTGSGLRRAELSPCTEEDTKRRVLKHRFRLLQQFDNWDRQYKGQIGLRFQQLQNEDGIPRGNDMIGHMTFLEDGGYLVRNPQTNLDDYYITDRGRLELRRLDELVNAPDVERIVVPAFHGATILTGAGFSHNFGGYLAKQFFNEMLGLLAKDRALRDRAFAYANFEEALFELERSGDEQASSKLRDVIRQVFIRMDDEIKYSVYGEGQTVFRHRLNKLLARLWSQKHGVGYLFTLNQDLLMERAFYNHDEMHGMPVMPGVETPVAQRSTDQRWFRPFHIDFNEDQISDIQSPSLNGGAWPPKLELQYNYIKLHGSFNWRDPNGYPMVLGGAKARQIDKYPLLKWYRQVFESVINVPNVRLLVIGYGFGDIHINRALAQAVRNSGLKLFIWDRSDSRDVMNKILADDVAAPIWEGVEDFTDRPMADVMPMSQAVTPVYKNINRWLFQREVHD